MNTPRNAPGLIVAPLTPFTADPKVDEAGLQSQNVSEKLGAATVQLLAPPSSRAST